MANFWQEFCLQQQQEQGGRLPWGGSFFKFTLDTERKKTFARLLEGINIVRRRHLTGTNTVKICGNNCQGVGNTSLSVSLNDSHGQGGYVCTCVILSLNVFFCFCLCQCLQMCLFLWLSVSWCVFVCVWVYQGVFQMCFVFVWVFQMCFVCVWVSHLARCVCACVSVPDVFYVSLDSDEEVVSRLCWKEHHFSATPTPCFDDDDDDYENNDIRTITSIKMVGIHFLISLTMMMKWWMVILHILDSTLPPPTCAPNQHLLVVTRDQPFGKIIIWS